MYVCTILIPLLLLNSAESQVFTEELIKVIKMLEHWRKHILI